LQNALLKFVYEIGELQDHGDGFMLVAALLLTCGWEPLERDLICNMASLAASATNANGEHITGGVITPGTDVHRTKVPAPRWMQRRYFPTGVSPVARRQTKNARIFEHPLKTISAPLPPKLDFSSPSSS
jgi:hypothetical protein